MKLGVLSDTHDQGDLIRQAIQCFNEENVTYVFHCGDWVSPFILYFFQGLRAPLMGVFGNNDGDRFRHLLFKEKWGLNLTYEERFLETTLEEKAIAVFHGDYPGLVDSLVRSNKYDLVLHGHTHLKVNQYFGKTLSLNPGSLMKETSATVKGASVAIYDTQEHKAKHIAL